MTELPRAEDAHRACLEGRRVGGRIYFYSSAMPKAELDRLFTMNNVVALCRGSRSNVPTATYFDSDVKGTPHNHTTVGCTDHFCRDHIAPYVAD